MKTLKSENDVKALVKDWFTRHGAWSYAPIQNGMGVHGIPDRIGCVPLRITANMVGDEIGVFVGIECKKPGRRGEVNRGMSAHQKAVLESITEAAGLALVCDGLEDLAPIERELHDNLREVIIGNPKA